MDSLSPVHVFQTISAGPMAAEIIGRQFLSGRVAAVFRSTFYVEFGARFVCIGPHGLQRGPLSLTTDMPGTTDWKASGLLVDEKARLSADTLHVGHRFRFKLSGVHKWIPCSPPGIETDSLRRGLAALARQEFNGISQLPAAQAPIVAVRHWLHGRFNAQQYQWPEGLVGLGPGLTPSGDDFLGGMMIALHALGQKELAEHMWHSCKPEAEAATNAISLALLEAASCGIGSEALHRLINVIIEGDGQAVRANAKRVAQIGHTSGWDATAGAYAAMDCWLAAQDI